MTLTLPWPISVNAMYRSVNGRSILSARGRAYRSDAIAAIFEQGRKRMRGCVELDIHLYPPDRRLRDGDNALKALWDALVHGGVIEDDAYIERFTVTKHPSEGKPGRAVVTIARWP